MLLNFQEELSSKDLFHAVYGKKILRDFKEGNLDDDGNPVEPSEQEKMTRDEAWVSECGPQLACAQGLCWRSES